MQLNLYKSDKMVPVIATILFLKTQRTRITHSRNGHQLEPNTVLPVNQTEVPLLNIKVLQKRYYENLSYRITGGFPPFGLCASCASV